MTPTSPVLVDVRDLVGLRDIAEHYQVGIAAVCNWRTRYADFPQPVATPSVGNLFLRPQVEAWHRSWVSTSRT